jgi:hypothetical protein
MDSQQGDDPRPIVCVDMNGVLDMYTGWKDADHWDRPRAGAIDFLRQLRGNGFRVVVFTTRYADDVWRWLHTHGFAAYVDAVTDRKPPAHVFVDDRAVRFTGNFAETLRQITDFTAHWEQPTDASGAIRE